MGLTGMISGALSGDSDIAGKLGELGVDPSTLEGLDVEAAKALFEERGFDLSMLDSLGLNIEDLLAKFTGSE